jgi:REP element-mobilizing transposase RayT
MIQVMEMDNDKDLPKRKSTRLKNFDYSSAGAYFVTICVRDRMQILSEIVRTDLTSANKTNGIAVGEGLAPPEITVKLKPCGEIVKEQLQLIETRFPSVTVEDYVIMPDHIHAVIFLHGKAGGASPSPTLDDVICAFKSLTSRSCKQKYGIEKMFQRSSAEHIVRDREDYETRRKYIYENPKRWYYKYLNTIE